MAVKKSTIHFISKFFVCSRTSLLRTPQGQRKVSVLESLERSPLYRGREYFVTLKAPLMVLKYSLSQNWPKGAFKLFNGQYILQKTQLSVKIVF